MVIVHQIYHFHHIRQASNIKSYFQRKKIVSEAMNDIKGHTVPYNLTELSRSNEITVVYLFNGL